MDFKQFFRDHWPPINNGCIARCAGNGRISNVFTQYLENQLHVFCNKTDSMLLREVRCDDSINTKSRRRLDYMICDKTEEVPYFFKGKKSTELRWHVCIEAQWDNRRFDTDFVSNDFLKLAQFSQESTAGQLKVAIAKVDFVDHQTMEQTFQTYNNRLAALLSDTEKEKSHYLTYLFALRGDTYHATAFDNFVMDELFCLETSIKNLHDRL